MAHRIDGRKLSRKRGPRLALYKNLTVSVLRYERVQTTEAKAKEIRGQVERMITLAKRGDLSARRTVVSELPNEPLVVAKLFDDIRKNHTRAVVDDDIERLLSLARQANFLRIHLTFDRFHPPFFLPPWPACSCGASR